MDLDDPTSFTIGPDGEYVPTRPEIELMLFLDLTKLPPTAANEHDPVDLEVIARSFDARCSYHAVYKSNSVDWRKLARWLGNHAEVLRPFLFTPEPTLAMARIDELASSDVDFFIERVFDTPYLVAYADITYASEFRTMLMKMYWYERSSNPRILMFPN